jgi:predicted RNase H-like HicB family nuclease
MNYRVGLPFWRAVANLGFPISIRVDVYWDPEAQVFVAMSQDLKGLVAEADTLDLLKNEVHHSIDELLSLELNHSHGNAIPEYFIKELRTA